MLFADILNKLDESTQPCDDFYQFSCGGFLKKAHIPKTDQSGIKSTSTELSEIVQYSLKNLLQNKQLMSNFSQVKKFNPFVYMQNFFKTLRKSFHHHSNFLCLLEIYEIFFIDYDPQFFSLEKKHGGSWLF